MPCPKAENVSHSRSPSPGVVQGNEELIRLIFIPDHCDITGNILESAFSRQDFTEAERGFSVHRASFVTKEAIERVCDGYLARNSSRALHTLAVGLCSNLRAVTDEEGNQVFCVTDDATQDDPSHALIHCSKQYTKAKFAKIRRHLSDIFNVLRSLDQQFNQEGA